MRIAYGTDDALQPWPLGIEIGPQQPKYILASTVFRKIALPTLAMSKTAITHLYVVFHIQEDTNPVSYQYGEFCEILSFVLMKARP